MAACLGLDIGGANLKAAHSGGMAASSSFPLWQTPERLPEALRDLLAKLPPAERLFVTMTGELADCFATKGEGVAGILAAVEVVAGVRSIHVWSTSGSFVRVEEAIADPLSVAAANWHALASWYGRTRQVGCGFLIDIGTTTTDLIPLRNGEPATVGLTDVGRLQAGELVYTGATRTPLCGIVQKVPYRGSMVPLAAEWFSTSLDVGLLLEEIQEDPSNSETANHRPATREAAWDRLARQLCCDRTECSLEEAVAVARFIQEQQVGRIRSAVERVLLRQEETGSLEILLSGSGRFLARKMIDQVPLLRSATVIDLGELLSPELASAACAYAVTKLGESE